MEVNDVVKGPKFIHLSIFYVGEFNIVRRTLFVGKFLQCEFQEEKQVKSIKITLPDKSLKYFNVPLYELCFEMEISHAPFRYKMDEEIQEEEEPIL